MPEITLQYLNSIANQIILISSLLAGFSVTVVANLIVHEAKDRLTLRLLKAATVSAACFLASVFSMTKILMKTSLGYPSLVPVSLSDLAVPQTIGTITFGLGIIALCVLIALSGWTKSRQTGIFTTIVASLTFLVMLIMMVDIQL